MSTNSYITYPVDADANTLSAEALTFLATAIPGYVPHEGNLEVWIIEAVAQLEAENRVLLSLVPAEIFRWFGKSVMSIPSIDAAPATAQSTWSMRDTTGYTIPQGTVVVYQPSGTSETFFQVQSDVVVVPGQSSTATGEVTLVAINPGTDSNGLIGQQVNLVSSLAYVSSITSTTTTAGGVDAETDDEYLSRLRAELKLLTPRPILPSDFAVLAQKIPGVDRSIAIDGYNPADSTYNNQRMIAVALADAAGLAVSSPIKAQVVAYLESLREVNFLVAVIDPTYTTIDVTATIKVLAGADQASVVAAATQAVADYLDPSAWSW